MRRFLANQQQFKNNSFTSIVAKQPTKRNNNTPQKRSTNTHPSTLITQQISPNANTSQILDKINEIITMIKDIKTDLQKMDIRIQNLEEDSYYYHDDDNWEKDPKDISNSPNTIQNEQLGRNTPTEQMEHSTDSAFSYQRKRPAYDSPERIDIQRAQHSLHTRIDQVEEFLENISETFTQLTDTQLTNPEYTNPHTHSQP